MHDWGGTGETASTKLIHPFPLTYFADFSWCCGLALFSCFAFVRAEPCYLSPLLPYFPPPLFHLRPPFSLSITISSPSVSYSSNFVPCSSGAHRRELMLKEYRAKYLSHNVLPQLFCSECVPDACAFLAHRLHPAEAMLQGSVVSTSFPF